MPDSDSIPRIISAIARRLFQSKPEREKKTPTTYLRLNIIQLIYRLIQIYFFFQLITFYDEPFNISEVGAPIECVVDGARRRKRVIRYAESSREFRSLYIALL